MAKRKSIAHILLSRIDKAHQQGRGRSKRADRQAGVADNRIYSDVTARNYADMCKRFARWVRSTHPEAWKDIDAAQALVPEYLGSIDNPGTTVTVANALSKGFGIGTGSAWGVVNAAADMAAHVAPHRNTANYQENNMDRIISGHWIVDRTAELLTAKR